MKEPLNESISEVQSIDEAHEAKLNDSELPSDSNWFQMDLVKESN